MSTGAPTERLFLAAALTEEVRTALDAHLRSRSEALPGKVVPPANWHLTLRFLGEVTAAARAAVLEQLEGAELGPPLHVELGGWGAFPRPARASVLWLGVRDGLPALRELAERVEAAVVAAGLPPERRPFSAHLTLSRLRQPLDVRPLLDRLPPFHARMAVEEVVLYRSHLGAGPPRYEAAARVPLA